MSDVTSPTQPDSPVEKNAAPQTFAAIGATATGVAANDTASDTASRGPIKIVLLTGYLGAGKTTLLNHVLSNDQGIRAAVIVNDIGEVNVDASLIRTGGLTEDSNTLIPLTNGCICCTLSDDLSAQLSSLAASGEFDYVIIEASGICEPIPIAYTISAFCEQPLDSASTDTAADSDAAAADKNQSLATLPMLLDNVVCVVDCARMYDEFAGGQDLIGNFEEHDIEALLVQQLEFCTTVVLNKCDLVTSEQLAELKALVRGLQRDAVIVEATEGRVDLSQILDTGRFNFEDAYNSAAWTDAMDHPEEHHDPEVLEYGIKTFVYQRRRPFDMDALSAFAHDWPDGVVRTKGIVWIAQDPDMCYLLEQAGHQVRLGESGLFVASAPDSERDMLLADQPELAEDWDPECGDRMTKLVLIGRNIDPAGIAQRLDTCLGTWEADLDTSDFEDLEF